MARRAAEVNEDCPHSNESGSRGSGEPRPVRAVPVTPLRQSGIRDLETRDWSRPMRLLTAVAAILPFSLALGQQPKPSSELKYTLIVTRHGVRAPTWTPERLNEYSSSPWPDFGVPPGNLTPR